MPEALGEILRLGAVFIVGVLGGGIAGFILGRRANRELPRRRIPVEADHAAFDRTEIYRAAVEAAWADAALSAAARERLGEMERRFDIGGFQAEGIEREVMGRPKGEIEAPPKEGLRRYRAAVEAVGAGEGMASAVRDRLDMMEIEFGLGGDEADGIELEILGMHKEEIEAPPTPELRLENGSAQYLAAVRLAWADHRLNPDEERQLGLLEGSLVMEEGEADGIEVGVMGGLREKIVRLDETPPESPDERWEGLVEECVELVEELDRNMKGFDEPRRELADHTVWRLAEVMERSGVDLISDDDEAFDKKRHQPVGSKASPDARVEETLSPGFAVGRRVLRRAKVRVE